MNQSTEVPTTVAVQEPAAEMAGAHPAANGQETAQRRPASDGENLRGADVRSEFARSRRARRDNGSERTARATPADINKPSSDNGTPQTPEGAPASNDSGTSNVTSTPATDAAAVEALANGTTEATSPTTNTTTELDADDVADLVDDPEVLAKLNDDEIKAIKDKSLRKLVKRVKVLTKELHRARSPGAETESDGKSGAAPADPRLTQISSEIGRLQRVVEWAQANPDGGQYLDENGKPVATYNAQQVDAIIANGQRQIIRLEARREATEELARERHREAERGFHDQAVQAYPWILQTDSQEYQQAAQVLRAVPQVRAHPEWPLWVADAVEGRRARLARVAAASKPVQPAKPAARQEPPKVPPPTSAAAPRTNPGAKELAEAEATFERTGKAADLKRVMILRRQASRQAA